MNGILYLQLKLSFLVPTFLSVTSYTPLNNVFVFLEFVECWCVFFFFSYYSNAIHSKLVVKITVHFTPVGMIFFSAIPPICL